MVSTHLYICFVLSSLLSVEKKISQANGKGFE